jgi:hypothetical protein
VGPFDAVGDDARRGPGPGARPSASAAGRLIPAALLSPPWAAPVLADCNHPEAMRRVSLVRTEE